MFIYDTVCTRKDHTSPQSYLYIPTYTSLYCTFHSKFVRASQVYTFGLTITHHSASPSLKHSMISLLKRPRLLWLSSMEPVFSQAWLIRDAATQLQGHGRSRYGEKNGRLNLTEPFSRWPLMLWKSDASASRCGRQLFRVSGRAVWREALSMPHI